MTAAADLDPPAPDEPLCTFCGRAKQHRRTLCLSCWRKCSECAIPMPPKRAPGRKPMPLPDRIAAVVKTMPDGHRLLFLRALTGGQ